MPKSKPTRGAITYIVAVSSVYLLLAIASLDAAASPRRGILHARGINMVYDESTNLTWVDNSLFDTGSAFDDGFSPTDGRMTYASAQAWVAQLSVFNPDTGKTVSDWRLPDFLSLTATVCGGPNCNFYPGVSGASEVVHLLYEDGLLVPISN